MPKLLSMILCIALVAVGGRAAASPPTPTPSPSTAGFPAQPEGVPFPTEDWPEGEWPTGIDRAAINEAVDAAFADGGLNRVRAVVIIYRGKLIYERYSPDEDDGPYKIMPGYSMAKSFTSALVGILVRDGKLDVYAPAAILAWNTEGDPRREITLDDLLRMSSGLEWEESPYPNPGDQTNMLTSDDAAAYAADKELAHPPGTEFLYSSANTILIDRILADVIGKNFAFRQFVNTELLDKIGIYRLDMIFDAQGTWLGSFAADTTARNFAKFGLLYLRDGVWDGERILPEGWVEYSRTPSAANPEYGAGWWLDLERPGVFYAVGKAGQVITVDPAHDLTFVHLATNSAIALPVSEAILNAFAGQP